MSLLIIILWVIGITAFTLLGSWYARRYNRADLLIALYVTFVLVAQVLAVKIGLFDLGFGVFTAPAAVLVFSVTFLLTDIVNEKFGRAETQRMILVAFASQVAMVFFFYLGVKIAPAPFWPGQEAWQGFFGLVPRITFASWAAFLISENADAYLFAWFKKLTGGKHLWTRNVFSSIPSLLLDSLIFVPLAFGGLLPLWPLIVGQVAVKWLVGVINVPFMYLNKWMVERE
jgi:queuosine precursor transporter